MTTRQPPKRLSLAEQRRFILPAMLGIVLSLLGMLISESLRMAAGDRSALLLVLYCLGGIAYSLLYYFVLLPRPRLLDRSGWVNAVIVGLGLALLGELLVDEKQILVFVLSPLVISILSFTARRAQTYLVIGLLSGLYLLVQTPALDDVRGWLNALFLPAMTIFISETMRLVQTVLQTRVQRLEAANEFARQIASSLDNRRMLTLLGEAIKNALPVDTFFLGLQDGDLLSVDLLYDDGEYYAPACTQLEGTLSNWVLKHNQTLFIPDLREEPELEGVRVVLVGKHKTNLTWLGVPIRTANLNGVLVAASYSVNAFTHNDVELLENMAQHVALALENTRRHAQVELQSHLDSLTSVFNHGHFLQLLRVQAEKALQEGYPLGVIMLDVDFFKQYNDQYGHLAGDEILTTLCAVIRRHIKQEDIVGRWGGEEFVIALPNANGAQAGAVAERIRQSMSEAAIIGRDRRQIPAPTVTQGIAIFPEEADEIYRLIDLADRRLYVAKERGRNQIEPQPVSSESATAPAPR